METDTGVWTRDRPDRDTAADLQLLRLHFDFRDAPFYLFAAAESGGFIHEKPAAELQFLSVSAVSAVLGTAESDPAVDPSGQCGSGGNTENPANGGG